jgi:PASTA domain
LRKVFDITATPMTIALDSRGQGETVYTVTNVTGRRVRGRAGLDEKDPAVVNKWARIDGVLDRDFDINGVQQYTVKLTVPPGSAEGKYTVRIFASLTDRPDEGDFGPSAGFTVMKTEPKPNGGIKWWIPVLAVVVLLVVVGGGLGIWFATRGIKVPSVKGLAASEATKTLQDAKLAVNEQLKYEPTTDENSAGKVLKQEPEEGTRVKKGDAVTLTLGNLQIPVPIVTGLSYERGEAQQELAKKHLGVGQVTLLITGHQEAGKVFDQKPKEGTLNTGDKVDLWVEKTSVTVPDLSGLSLQCALWNLGRKGLTLGQHPASFDEIIGSQNPAPHGPPVELNTRVDVFARAPQPLPPRPASPTGVLGSMGRLSTAIQIESLAIRRLGCQPRD